MSVRLNRASLLKPCLGLLGLTLLPLGAAQAQSNHAEAVRLNNQGLDVLHQNQPEQALELLTQALKLDPEDEVIRHNRVMALIRLKRFEEARTEVDDYLLRYPLSWRFRHDQVTVQWGLQLFSDSHFNELKIIAADSHGTGGGDDAPRHTDEEIAAEVWELIPLAAAKPQTGEIRLDGQISLNSGGRLTLSAMVFGVPTGRYQIFEEPKSKNILLGENSEPIYGGLGSIPAAQLKRGDFVAVVGKDTPQGFVARRMVVAPRSQREEKERGSLFDAASVPLPETTEKPQIDEKALGETIFRLKQGQVFRNIASVLARDGGQQALLTSLRSFIQANPQDNSLVLGSKTVPFTSSLLASTMEVRGPDDFSDASILSNLMPPPPLHVFSGGDVVAVGLDKAPITLPLAEHSSARGEVAYLAAWNEGKLTWIPSSVAYSDEKRLILHVSSSGNEARTDGSPIVNPKGEIVGLQVADDEGYISAVSLDALRRAIKTTVPAQ